MGKSRAALYTPNSGESAYMRWISEVIDLLWSGLLWYSLDMEKRDLVYGNVDSASSVGSSHSTVLLSKDSRKHFRDRGF